MAIGDVIVSATDYNRSVQELSDLHDTLYDLKKEFENIHSVFNVDKETLQNKIGNVENIFKKIELKQNNSASNLLEAKNDFEELIKDFNIYKENSKKELKNMATQNVKEIEQRVKDTKTKKLEELEAINKEYILHIQDLNEKLGANKTLFEDKLDKLKATYEIVNKNYNDFTKDFNKKNWYLITFVLLACSVTAFFCGFMVKHQLMMSQLKSSVPLSTFQSVLPFIKPFF